MELTRESVLASVAAGWDLADVKNRGQVRVIGASRTRACIKHDNGVTAMIPFKHIIDLHREEVPA